MIKEYTEITSILLEIEKRLKRSNIFISGAAHTYDPYSEDDAKSFIHKLSYKLAENNFIIVSGYGLGIGSIVINGALDYKLNSNYQNLDDLLILRPFAQIQSGKRTIPDISTNYRKEMISQAGIAIFLFGNKLDKGSIVNSNGMIEEFEICLSRNVIPIPIGCTGYISKELWGRITSDISKYYPNNHDLLDSFNIIGDSTKSIDEIIKATLRIIYLLQDI